MTNRQYQSSVLMTMKRRDFLRFCVSSAAGVMMGSCGRTKKPSDLPNIVLVLTDDQRWDTLWAMPIVSEKLVKRGVTFTNAFVTTPICGPCRASILSGGYYAHNTGVLTNGNWNGGMNHFRDVDSLSTALQQSGYKTGFVGKYMHGYRPGYMPPGWTRFVANSSGGMIRDWFNLVDITVGKSGTLLKQVRMIKRVRQYVTDFQRDQALEFLDRYGDSPFFLFLSTYAPHSPFITAPGDEDKFSDFSWPRQRAYREKDVTDKPEWVRKAVAHEFPWRSRTPTEIDSIRRDQLRSLAPVDRAVGAIIRKIADLGKTEQTIIIFTSDNGLIFEEHGLCDKGSPYEEAIRVPLVVVMPGVEPGVNDNLVAMNLDVGATVLDLGRTNKPSDGLSLVPLLERRLVSWRDEILLESFGYLDWWSKFGFEAPGLGFWAGLRTKSPEEEWKYVEHPTGEKELYDLTTDPYEEENKHSDPEYHSIVESLSQRLDRLKGLMITVVETPEGIIGQDYKFKLTAWGGKKPYRWSIVDGDLPEGLCLDRSAGVIQGIPKKAGNKSVRIQVTDSSTGKHTGKLQYFVSKLTFFVKHGPQDHKQLIKRMRGP